MPLSPEQKYQTPHTIDGLCQRLQKQDPAADIETVKIAYEFAADAHKDQKRATGEPYIIHPLAVAITLAEMHMPTDIVTAGLLHDVPEDTSRTLDDIRVLFGEDVASMVGGITKLGKIKYRGMERYIENLRKMFIAIAADVRVVFIKFADRLHNLQTLDAIPPQKQYRIALESLEIYAPIANRLGMGDIRGRLEDAAFRYVYPKEYEWVLELSKKTRQDKHDYLERVIKKTQDMVVDAGLKGTQVHGRAKHLYSLYQKLLQKERNIAHIYDIIAVRVIVESIGDCYATLGIIHGKWTPLKGRIKDYIAQPKPNGYRSLHTTVFCEDGEIVEFQIRTSEMHLESEYGIAAHWWYDENKADGRHKQLTTPVPKWFHELSDIQNEFADKDTYLSSLEDIKIDLFQNHIFVFTPNGDVIDLPEGSSCIDFAYAIHTEIGNTCVAAKVNDEVAPLQRTLKNGDMVEIMVDKSRKGPNPDWLKYVKTRHAKSQVRQVAKSRINSWIKGILPGGRS